MMRLPPSVIKYLCLYINSFPGRCSPALYSIFHGDQSKGVDV